MLLHAVLYGLQAFPKEHGLTQSQMAERVGVHVSQYKRYECTEYDGIRLALADQYGSGAAAAQPRRA